MRILIRSMVWIGLLCLCEVDASIQAAPAQFFESWSKATLGNAKSVAFGNGVYAAVGDQSTLDQTTLIYISTNGTEWAEIRPGGIRTLYSVCFGKGRFLAAGFNATMISDDGSVWNFQVQTQTLIKVIADGAGFAAVTADGRAGFSEDGLKWDFQNTGTNWFLEGIAYANGRYVIGGEGRLCVSTNKTEWKEAFFPNHTFNEVVFGKGLFVAAGAEGPRQVDAEGSGRAIARNQIWISVDGLDWKKVNEEWSDVIQTVSYCNGVFVAAGSWGHLLISNNGINWSKKDVSFNSFKISCANNRYFSAGYPFIWSSPEIMSFEAQATELRIFGPIGKVVRIHSMNSIGGAITSSEVILTSTPTILNVRDGFVFGTIE